MKRIFNPSQVIHGLFSTVLITASVLAPSTSWANALVIWREIPVTIAYPPAIEFNDTPPLIRPTVTEKNQGSKIYNQSVRFRFKAEELVKRWYPFLRKQLRTPHPIPADKHIELIYTKEAGSGRAAASTRDNQVYFYDSYTETEDNKQTYGTIIHEIVHLLQYNYLHFQPAWMSEAIAYYYQYALYEAWSVDLFLNATRHAMGPDHTGRSIEQRFQEVYGFGEPLSRERGFQGRGYIYTADALHAAGMLRMIDAYYYPHIVEILHQLLEQHANDKQLFTNQDLSNELFRLTGKTLNEFWCEYIARAIGDQKRLNTCYKGMVYHYLPPVIQQFW